MPENRLVPINSQILILIRNLAIDAAIFRVHLAFLVQMCSECKTHVLLSMSRRIFLRTLLGMNISPQKVDTLLVFMPKQDTRNIDCV